MTPSLNLTSAGILSLYYHTGVLNGTFNGMSWTLVTYIIFQYKLPGTCKGFYLTPTLRVQDEKWVRLHAFSFISLLFLTQNCSLQFIPAEAPPWLLAVLLEACFFHYKACVIFLTEPPPPPLSGTLAEKKIPGELCMLAISCQELTAAAGGYQSLYILFL